VSSGLELIPLGIALVGILSQSVKERYAEQEVDMATNGNLASIPTRMIDSELLAQVLLDMGIETESDGTGLSVLLQSGGVRFLRAPDGGYWASFDRNAAKGVLEDLQVVEDRYSEVFRQNIAEQFVSNAQKAGLPIKQFESHDGVIRMRVTVS
jgi:hypothetical protein